MNRRVLLAICANETETGAPFWLPEEKAVAKRAEKAGLVKIVKTTERVGGYEEWRVFLVKGEK